MAHTLKRKPYRYFSKEGTIQRRMSTRKYRRVANRALRSRQEIPPFKGTGGWLTW